MPENLENSSIQLKQPEISPEADRSQVDLSAYPDYQRLAINQVYSLIDVQLNDKAKLLEDSSERNQQYWVVIRENLRKAGKNAAIQIADKHGRKMLEYDIKISGIEAEIQKFKEEGKKADDPSITNLNKQLLTLAGERDREKANFEKQLQSAVSNLIDVLKLIALKTPFHNRKQLDLQEVAYLDARDGQIGLFVGQIEEPLMNIIRKMAVNPDFPLDYNPLIDTLYGKSADLKALSSGDKVRVEEGYAQIAAATFILENLSENQQKQLAKTIIDKLKAFQQNPASNQLSQAYHEYVRNLMNPSNNFADKLKNLGKIQERIKEIEAAAAIDSAADMELYQKLPAYRKYLENERLISGFTEPETDEVYLDTQNIELQIYQEITVDAYREARNQRKSGSTYEAEKKYHKALKRLTDEREKQEKQLKATLEKLDENNAEFKSLDENFDQVFARIMADLEKSPEQAILKYKINSDFSKLEDLKNNTNKKAQTAALIEWMEGRKLYLSKDKPKIEKKIKEIEESLIVISREIQGLKIEEDGYLGVPELVYKEYKTGEKVSDEYLGVVSHTAGEGVNPYRDYREAQKDSQETELKSYEKIKAVEETLANIREEIRSTELYPIPVYDVAQNEKYIELVKNYALDNLLTARIKQYAASYVVYSFRERSRLKLVNEAEDYFHSSARMKGSLNTVALPEARDLLYWEISDHEKYKEYREGLIDQYRILRDAYREKKSDEEKNKIKNDIEILKTALTGTITAKRQDEFIDNLLKPWTERLENLAQTGGPITGEEMETFKKALKNRDDTVSDLKSGLENLFEKTTLEELRKQVEEAEKKLDATEKEFGKESMEYLESSRNYELLKHNYQFLYPEAIPQDYIFDPNLINKNYRQGLALFDFLNNGNPSPIQIVQLQELKAEAERISAELDLSEALAYQESDEFKREAEYLTALESLLPFMTQAQREGVLAYATENKVNLTHIKVNEIGEKQAAEIIDVAQRIRDRYYTEIQENLAKEVVKAHKKVIRGSNLNPAIRGLELKNLLAVGAIGVSFVTIVLNLWVNRNNLGSLPGNMCLWGATAVGGTAAYAYGKTGGDVGEMLKVLERGPNKNQKESLAVAERKQEFMQVYNAYPSMGDLFMNNLNPIAQNVKRRLTASGNTGRFEINVQKDIPQDSLKKIKTKYPRLTDEALKNAFTEMYAYLIVENKFEQLPKGLLAFRDSLKNQNQIK